MLTEFTKSSTLEIQELDIAEGLKQLLMDAGFTIDLILDLGYREISEKLHIDSYVGKLIVDSAQDIVRKRNPSQDISEQL
jgi:hypothetical protein